MKRLEVSSSGLLCHFILTELVPVSSLLWGSPPTPDPRYFCFALFCFVLYHAWSSLQRQSHSLKYRCQRSIYQTHIMLTVKRKEKLSTLTTLQYFRSLHKSCQIALIWEHSHITQPIKKVLRDIIVFCPAND